MPVIPNPDPQVWRMILSDLERKSREPGSAEKNHEPSRTKGLAGDDSDARGEDSSNATPVDPPPRTGR